MANIKILITQHEVSKFSGLFFHGTSYKKMRLKVFFEIFCTMDISTFLKQLFQCSLKMCLLLSHGYGVNSNVAPCCSSHHYCTASYNKVGSNPAHGWRFVMVRTSNNCRGWKIGFIIKNNHHHHHHHHRQEFMYISFSLKWGRTL